MAKNENKLNGRVTPAADSAVYITNVTQKKRGRGRRNILLASTAIGAIGYGAWQAGRTRFTSKIDGKLDVKGLKAPVEVIRDKWGIPHIYAENLADLMFAQGYVHAQDRFWQMEFNRRLAMGRLSEVLGEVTLPVDKMMRRLLLSQVAHADYAFMEEGSPEKLVVESYAEGVNAFLATKKLPLEFSLLRYKPEPWSAIDSLAWAKMIGVGQSTGLESSLVRARMVQAVGPEKAIKLEPTHTLTGTPMIIPPGADYSGVNLEALQEELNKLQIAIGAVLGTGNSNNWVVNGSRSASGKPILCNDPHMSLSMPGLWYEIHLHSPEIDVIGSSIPCVPLVLIGHNRQIAWGITNTMASFQDAFIEKTDPANPRRYEYKGEWRDFEVIREEIKIKGKPSVQEEYFKTVHGQVLNHHQVEVEAAADSSGYQREIPVSVSWTLYEKSTMLKSILKLNQAKNWQEFREALSFWNLASFNLVYADVEGNIGYQFTGLIPVRGKGLGMLPAPGHTGEYDWQGFIPFEELPNIYNPESGYIITTNQKVVDNHYPHWLGSDYLGANRAARLRELITGKPVLTLDDMATFQTDQKSLPGMRLARRLVQLDTALGDEWQRRALGYLATWDGTVTSLSIGGCLYEVVLQKLARVVFEPLLGKATEGYLGNTGNPLAPLSSLQSIAYSFLIDQVEANDPLLLPEGKNWDQVLREALVKAIQFLREKLGDNIGEWEWGKLHQVTYNHPLGSVKPLDRIFNRGPFPMGGDWDTVWQAGYSSDKDNFAFNGATSAIRLLADLADWERTRFGTTGGQSGSPFSPHYADFIEEYLSGEHHPHYFNRASILEHAEGRLTLNPAH